MYRDEGIQRDMMEY